MGLISAIALVVLFIVLVAIVKNVARGIEIVYLNPRVTLGAGFVLTSIACVTLGILNALMDLRNAELVQLILIGIFAAMLGTLVVLAIYAAVQGLPSERNSHNQRHQEELEQEVDAYLDAPPLEESSLDDSGDALQPEDEQSDQKIPN